jgi:peptidyl-prolyl cis-trans isomerase D
MLQSIRDRAQGWIAWFIVILISVPFALWGIQEYLGVGSEPVIAKVNDTEITERQFESRYRDYRAQLRQRLGDAYRPDLFDENMLRQETLEAMVRDELVVQKADDLGMKAGDALVRAEIARIPVFQVDGRFSMTAYERTLRSQGLSPQGFEQRMYRGLVSDQLQNAVSGTAWVTDAELAESVRLRRQQRSFAYLTIAASAHMPEEPPSDAEIQEYYETHTQDFIAPEQVKVDYIELDRAAISETLEADEAELLAYYEQHKGSYITPERRRASHILFLAEEGANPAQLEEARNQAQAVRERALAGEDFGELAKELSQDPGSAEQGGDLGFFGRDVMDPAFEEASFTLEEGAISEPVRSAFGFHIIKVTGIQPEGGKSFEEARREVEEAHLRAEAERVYYEYAEQLADLAYEDPTTLLPAADALGIEIEHSDWIPRQGGMGLFRNPKLTAAAFSDDVLYQGNNSELVEITPEHSVVLRVVEHKEAATKPLEEVRDQIIASLKQQQASAKAKQSGEAQLAKLNASGAKLEEIAEELELELVTKELVERNSAGGREVANAVFRMAAPEAGQTLYQGLATANGDYLLIGLSQVKDGDISQLSDNEKEQLRRALAGSMGRAEYEHILVNLRSDAKVELRLKSTQDDL